MALLDERGSASVPLQPPTPAQPLTITPDALLATRPRRLSFSRYESRGSRVNWQKRQELERSRRLFQQRLASTEVATQAAKFPSVSSLNERLSAAQRQRKYYDFKAAQLERTDVALPKIKTITPPSNPFIDLFPEGEPRIAAQAAMKPLLPHTRAIVTLALDPRDTLPLVSFDEETRQAVAGARAGNVADLARLTGDAKMLGRLTDSGSAFLIGRDAVATARRRLAQVTPRPVVDHAAQLEHEQVIREATDTARARFRDAEQTFQPTAADALASARVENTKKYFTYIAKIRSDYYPDNPDVKFQVSEKNDAIVATEGKNVLGRFPLPSQLVEHVHGQSVAEDFMLKGYGALPEDSPLTHGAKPLGKAVLRLFGDIAESPWTIAKGFYGVKTPIKAPTKLYGGPAYKKGGAPLPSETPSIEGADVTKLDLLEELRQGQIYVKKHVIEPILPEFEVPLNRILPYAIPQLTIAELSLQGLKLAGLQVPTVSEVIGKTAPFTTDIKITDNLVAELTSYVLDPANLLPFIGFGDSLARIGTRIGVKIAGEEGLRVGLKALSEKALAKLGRDPEFIKLGERGVALLDAEKGIFAAGGRSGQLEARVRVLQDISDGVETTDANLLPVRRAVEDLLSEAPGVTEKLSVEQLRVEANAIQDSMGLADKVKLTGLGIDPQAVDDPIILARIRAEAPEVIDANPRLAELASRVEKQVPAQRAKAMLDGAKDELSKLGRGETGGGRLRALQPGDRVSVREGQFAGEQGVITNTLKRGQLEIELDSGRTIQRADHQIDPVDFNLGRLSAEETKLADQVAAAEAHGRTIIARLNSEAEAARAAGRVDEADRLLAEAKKMSDQLIVSAPRRGETIRATASRLNEIDALKSELNNTRPSPVQRKAIQAKIDLLKEQGDLADTFTKAMEPGGTLETRAMQRDEMTSLKRRLAAAKGEGRKAPIRRRILALEEAMQPAEAPISTPAGDAIDEIKNAYLASQSDTLDHLAWRQNEIKFQLEQRRGMLNADEIISLDNQLREVENEYIRLRSEADEAVEQLMYAKQEIEEGAITASTLRLQDFERFAFARTSPAGKVAKLFSKIPILGKPIHLYDPSLYHADNFIGRMTVAYGRLQLALDSASQTAYFAMKAKGIPFELEKGVETTTGRMVGDLVKDWPNVKHLFSEEQDAFVQLLNRTRLEALRDGRILEPGIFPDAWDEATYAFRTATSKSGINFRNLRRGGSAAKPGSLRHQSYQFMADGLENGVEYGTDIVEEYYAGIKNLREYAARKSFLNAIKYKEGVPLKLLTAQEGRLLVGLSARDYSWAKVARMYAHQSVLGLPPKPVLRASKLFEVEPPNDVVRIVDRIHELNAVAKSPERTAELRQLRSEIDEITSRNGARLRAHRAEVKGMRESINTQVQSEGARWGKPGQPVETSVAPFSKFPELGGRLYLKDEIDYLMKVAGRDDNAFIGLAKIAAGASGVMKTGQTAFDPGFWFIQGLGAIGLDMTNLLRGRPTAIWAKSMYRSLVGLTREQEAAKFWADEAAKHFDDWTEYIQRTGILAGHQGQSDEVIQELIRGGFIEKIEAKIPGFNKLHMVSRVGNAFSNFMNAASWETWKALRPLAKTEHEVEELASFVRSISGRNSAKAMGISYGQEMVERGFLYAREYTRASAAIVAKAVLDPLSFGGRQAIKSLAGLGMAMTFAFGGASLISQLERNGWNLDKVSWEDLADDLKDTWDPRSSKFMTRRMGKATYGIGGGVRSIVTLVARLGKAGYYDTQRIQGKEVRSKSTLNPFDFTPEGNNIKGVINWDHPALKWLRGKASPSLTTPMDVLSGRDYLGYTVGNTRDFYWKLPLNLAPFGVQAAINQQGLGIRERVGIGTAEWFGFKTNPVDKRQLYHEEAERSLQDKWVNLKQTDFLKQAESDKEHFPELYAAKQLVDHVERMKASEYQKLDDIIAENKKKTEDALVPLAAQIKWGVPGGGELFSDQNKYYVTQASNDRDVAAKTLGIDYRDIPPGEYPNKDAGLEAQYSAIEPLDFLTPDGLGIDWDRYNAARDEVKRQMSPRNQRAVEEKRFNVGYKRLEAALRRKAQANDDLKPYYDAPKYNGLDKTQEKAVDDLFVLAKQVVAGLQLSGHKASLGDIFQFMYQTGYGDKAVVATAFVLTKKALAPMVRSTVARDWLMSHPDLAVFYPHTFFDLSEEDQQAWLDRYGMRRGVDIIGSGPLPPSSVPLSPSGNQGY